MTTLSVSLFDNILQPDPLRYQNMYGTLLPQTVCVIVYQKVAKSQFSVKFYMGTDNVGPDDAS